MKGREYMLRTRGRTDGKTDRRTDGLITLGRPQNGALMVQEVSYFVSNAKAIIPVADGAENDVPFNPSEQDDENEVDV